MSVLNVSFIAFLVHRSFYINLHLFIFTTIAFTFCGGIKKMVYLCVRTREKVYLYDIQYNREES